MHMLSEFLHEFQTEFEQIMVSNLQNKPATIRIGEKSISVGHDSKLISKILETLTISLLTEYCDCREIRYKLNDVQNRYPDFVMYTNDDEPIAVDVKTSYIASKTSINGFTLGTYMGYFQNRQSGKNTVLPYNYYTEHLCICILYRRVIDNFEFVNCVIRPKWMLASRQPGSGNTKNIGSIKNIEYILASKSVFQTCEEFDQFWLDFGKTFITNKKNLRKARKPEELNEKNSVYPQVGFQ